MLTRFSRTWAALLGAAAVLVLAGCGSGNSTTPQSAQPVNGGTVTVNLYQKWVALNPFNPGPDNVVTQLAYEPLTLIGGDTLSVISRLATINASSDATTFTFKLKPGLKWSDGQPFTSQDILFSYDAYSNPKVSIYAPAFKNVVGIADFVSGATTSPSGFTTPDDSTFVIKLSSPYAPFLVNLSSPTLYLLPKHSLGSVAPSALSANSNPFWTHPVGLGPYKLVQVVPDQYIEFDKNPNYVNPVHLDKVFVKAVTAAVAVASVQSGEMDLSPVAAADVTNLKSVSTVTTYELPGTSGIHIVVNLDKPYFQDKRVRQAMLTAIDRKGLVQTVLAGQAVLANTFPFGPPWAIGTDLGTYAYNPTKAKQLLTDAGWDFNRTVNLDLVPGITDRTNALNVVVGDWQAIGMKVNVRLIQAGQLLGARKDDTFDLSMSGTAVGTIDPDLGFVSLRCNTYYKTGQGTNFANYCNSTVDDLFTKARQTSDQSKRAPDYIQATKIVNDELPYLVLYVPKTLYASTNRLKGFKPNPEIAHTFWNAGDWYVTSK